MIMKVLFALFLIGTVSISFGQDSTQVTKPVGQKRVGSASTGPSNISFKKADPVNSTPKIAGVYTVERFSVQLNTTETKKAKEIVGTEIIISETAIVGTQMDSLSYRVSEVELMNTEDYLYRIFGEVPASIPDDLPLNVNVIKTDNLACYGIVRLSDGVVLIPYKGLLLYLRPRL
jgi:hypothetical protein